MNTSVKDQERNRTLNIQYGVVLAESASALTQGSGGQYPEYMATRWWN